MSEMSALGAAAIILISAAIAFSVLWAFGLQIRHRSAPSAPQDRSVTTESVFLFKQDTLIDQDASTQRFPGLEPRESAVWVDFRAWLDGRFGALPETLSEIGDAGSRTFSAVDHDDRGRLVISATGGGAHRVVLTDIGVDAAAMHDGRLIRTAQERFASVLHEAPCAVRISCDGGRTIWQNDLFSRFNAEEARTLQDASAQGGADRVRLPGEGRDDRQFEVLKQTKEGFHVLYATDVTKVVQAERVRREFVQTLTKTFANLTTGLAVFDRQKQLALFNPALLDLTGLPAAFLSGRPTLTQVFDRLRDRKVLPEPKNYCDWRDQINAMVASAADGLYLEDWSLPNGLTYRVTGRPHPDGAIAFLFEDISDEITLTRRFRSQLDLRQAVLDTMDKAIAVIALNNVVVLCNVACSEFLGIDPDTSFADMSLGDLLAACDTRLPDPAIWPQVESAVSGRQPAEHRLLDPDGVTWILRAQPLPGNAVMISIESSIASTSFQQVSLPA